ncbi:hypothetical protein M670_00042 [Schinkia azotoformans MEV2011]|uniref:Uncharacterized protein n=2 Tax=Schinkia azotoformans TaxID=1454 RepID=K6DQX7_SCHAZ|nr:hypothetical protein [Schinkia azotoformans]EKN63201.1 hypothetical protein BAZO_18151 [Schinkia azotoformans LMG 9581]KEF40030.1 hypothetical protein M670_00042 [Schinkia azotoformans MEV2011]MEC1637247.1 hypothetical protein [Schinkia azotoformans]MEC1694726.1 hypothetical protein [Schinkia azotoformans]MEC1716912.1 hypothetical protein [Schinkia azotoformans]
MEQTINEILKLLNQMNSNIMSKLQTIESRLARIEKMDSIEHYVSVNQIDLTDIKEILERIEESKCLHGNGVDVIETSADFVGKLNKRLDTQLLRIAKVEEEIELLKEK